MTEVEVRCGFRISRKCVVAPKASTGTQTIVQGEDNMVHPSHSSPDNPTIRAQMVLVAIAVFILLAAASPNLWAQTHVANPFAGATWYANPDYAAEVNIGIGQ